MWKTIQSLILAFALASAAQSAEVAHPGGMEILVLDDELSQLKSDFNAARGSVRLVFIVGPTCGICLRGMADLNDAFLAEMQGDDRLQTFVVHVPVLGATEAHIAPSQGLMNGPNIYHYWDPTGVIGQNYTKVLGIEVYAWDVWFAYGPDARWSEALPPAPAFWQHQLGPLPDELYLDAEDFAARTLALVEDLDRVESLTAAGDTGPAAEYEIDYVAQSPDRAEMSYIQHALGGRTNIDALVEIEMTGSLKGADGSRALTITASRPDVIRRSVEALPAELSRKLDAIFDFEGILFDWRAKDNELVMRGMVKHSDKLAWRIEMTTREGDHWELLVDSHTGNMLRKRLVTGLADDYLLDIRYSDFKKVGGILFPHRIEYRDSNGQLIATELIESIRLSRREEAAGPAD